MMVVVREPIGDAEERKAEMTLLIKSALACTPISN